jgi:orotidine-5'-phosphate decarboxylase
MTTKLIQVGVYRVGMDPAYSPSEKAVGIICSVDEKSGVVTVVSRLDEHGVRVVETLAEELRACKKALNKRQPTVVIPSIWHHYSGAKVAGIYEQAMNKAGVNWLNVDDTRREGC